MPRVENKVPLSVGVQLLPSVSRMINRRRAVDDRCNFFQSVARDIRGIHACGGVKSEIQGAGQA